MNIRLRHFSSGFALVNAIFLLMLMAALAALVASFSTSQNAGSAMDVQGSQAYQAARAGIEWGVYQQLRGASCVATTSFTPPAPTLSTFRVTVTCAKFPPGAASALDVYQIESTACNLPDVSGNCPGTAGGAHYVERQLRVTL
jgi:MSHA biogenesis protein MshP